MDNCVLFLSTYDGGADCWDGFFCALKEEWPEMNMPIYINTESKSYAFEGFDIRCLNADEKDMPWGMRLKKALQKIDTDYILLFLEDYWLDRKVNNKKFLDAIKIMNNNPHICNICFYPMPGNNIDDELFGDYELRPQKCEYKLNAQVALWRKDKLIEYTRNHESPWEWEVFGSRRATRYKDYFYSLKWNAERVFSYGDPDIGCVVHRGKWNLDVVKPFIDKYNLNINLNDRGIEDWNAIYRHRAEPIIKKIIKKNPIVLVKQVIINSYRYYLSIK